MKLEIRYDFGFQTLELDAEAMEGLWVCLSLEDGDGLSQEEKEQKLQERFDELFNKPELSNWRRHNRKDKFNHFPKVKRRDGKAGVMNPSDSNEPFNAMEYLCVTSDEETVEQDLEYYEICAWVREVLAKRPTWAEAFISVYLDGMLIRDYAARAGITENNANQRLWKAKKKLREAWLKKSSEKR